MVNFDRHFRADGQDQSRHDDGEDGRGTMAG